MSSCLLNYKFVSVGNQAILSCNPEVEADIVWSYYNMDDGEHQIIYKSGKLYDKNLRPRHKIKDNDPYYLYIDNAIKSDAGLYICEEENGNGATHCLPLSVIGSNSTTFNDMIYNSNETIFKIALLIMLSILLIIIILSSIIMLHYRKIMIFMKDKFTDNTMNVKKFKI